MIQKAQQWESNQHVRCFIVLFRKDIYTKDMVKTYKNTFEVCLGVCDPPLDSIMPTNELVIMNELIK